MDVLLKVYVEGPETCCHWYDVIIPSLSVHDPLSTTGWVGNVIALSAPALATGGLLGKRLMTVITILSLALPPSLSVTVNLNSYTPGSKLLIVVVADVGEE